MNEPGSQSDKQLLMRLADGNETAFAELYDRFGSRLYSAAVRMLASREEAEDVVQEVFVSLARSREHLRRVENLPAYLFVALRRMVAGNINKQRRFPRLQHCGLHELPANDEVDRQDLRDRLNSALQALPGDQRDVVIMKIDGQLTFAEIAHVLNLNPNTVASRYRYALDKLRDLLESER